MSEKRLYAANDPALGSFLLISDRLRSSGRHQHRQYGGRAANVARNRHQCFRYGHVLFRQSLKTRADVVELIDFVENRFKSHGYTALWRKQPKVRELQMDWLRSEDLKEEKVVTTPL